ncbi:serine hydrolase [Pigmentiphaga aceris]|uniref:beta-lactamase n=1 Tax=Pigmentiphaga aceris TaxID=1940612 RepID=A0A5C0AUR4_9BURK|nr:serine hydrolase [Pigmentiphaga aceris]QEI04650.1 serine hydrolase [Pigmentiphaga aceris]
MIPALSTLACAAAISLLVLAPASAADWPAELVKKIEQIDQRSPGSVGVYVKRLDDGKEMSYAGDRPWYLASTAKVPIAVAVLQQVERGKLSMDQQFALADTDKVDGSGELVWQASGKRYSVETLLDAMLMRSDNTAANILVRAIGQDTLNAGARDYMGRREVGELTSYTQIRYDVYSELHPSARDLSNRNLVEIAGADMGPARVQAFTRSAELKAADLQVDTMRDAYARYYQRGLNTATMEGYGAMLEKLVQGKLLPDAKRDMLFEYMKINEPGEYRLAGGLPRKTSFIHKTGTQFERACHVGVINPRESAAIVVAACVEGVDENKPAENLLREVGQAVAQTVMADKI